MRSLSKSLGALSALALAALVSAPSLAAGPAQRAAAATQRAPALSPASEAARPGLASSGGPLQALQADLFVKHTALAPVEGGGVPEGKHVMLDIRVENRGPIASTASAQYTLGCTVVQGNNPCPVAANSGPVPIVPAGSSRSIILVAAQGAQPGTYRVSIQVEPTKGRGRAYTREIKVTPKASLRKVPAGIGGLGMQNGQAGPAPRMPLPTVKSRNDSPLRVSETLPGAADLGVATGPAYGNLFCKVVFPGGDLNPHVHVRNATGQVLPAGQQINVWLPKHSFAFPLTHPLALNAWVAGPSVSPSQSYSEGQGKHDCVAATELD